MLVLFFLLIALVRLRLDVIVGLVALWLVLLWLQTGTYTMGQAASVLGVVVLVATMVYAEFYRKH